MRYSRSLVIEILGTSDYEFAIGNRVARLHVPNFGTGPTTVDLSGRDVMEWFGRTTSIAGIEIPNWVVVLGAIVVIWLIYTFI